MTIKRLVGLLGLGALLVGPAAFPQVQRSGGGESQKIMQQYQQLAAEKTSLQNQLAQAKKEVDAAKADLAAMKKERDALKAHAAGAGASAVVVSRLTAAKESAEKDAALQKQRVTEIYNKSKEIATNLRDVETDRSKLRKDLDERNAAYDKCADSNLQLSEITGDVLKRYEHVGPFTKVSAVEPFTKITRTRIENLVDEYRARAEELRVKKRTP